MISDGPSIPSYLYWQMGTKIIVWTIILVKAISIAVKLEICFTIRLSNAWMKDDVTAIPNTRICSLSTIFFPSRFFLNFAASWFSIPNKYCSKIPYDRWPTDVSTFENQVQNYLYNSLKAFRLFWLYLKVNDSKGNQGHISSPTLLSK